MEYLRDNSSYNISQDEYIFIDEALPLFQIVKLIPEGSSVLDVGAGNGALARILKKIKSNIHIDGVEPNAYASKIAQSNYDLFWSDSLENLDLHIDYSKYDFIVIADVIEHLENPDLFLKKIINGIRNNCKIIISLPNICFGSVRLSILNGYFDYVPSGIIEYTHLRFYSLKSVKAIIKSHNLNLETIIFLNRSFYRCEFSMEMLKCSLFLLLKILFDKNSRAYQFIFVTNKTSSEKIKILSVGCSAFQVIIDKYYIPLKLLLKRNPYFFYFLKNIYLKIKNLI